MDKYLYKVGFGIVEKGEVIYNWASKNVIATDAQEAIKKARLSKKAFPEEVEKLARVDVS